VHVVHLAQRFQPAVGGAETYVREIGLEQSRRGHSVTVLTTMPPTGAPREESVEVAGGVLRIVRFPTWHFRGDYLFPPWLPMKGAREWLARERYDLLHAHSYRFATVEEGARARDLRGVPLVVSALGFYPAENALVSLSRRVYDGGRGRRAMLAGDRFVALTQDEVPYHVALGIPPEKVDVIPPGLLPSALEVGDGARFRKEHALDGPVVLFLSRLAHDKGLGDLVAAMEHVPGATLAVVGPDAGARAGAKRLARRTGIAGRVRFLGPVASTRDAYAACDVFVHPSHYDAFGMVIIEAQAQGKPVVTTSAGGCPDAGGAPALLVPPHAPSAIADAVNALLADPVGRAQRGERGRARAKEFLWSRLADRMEGTYARAAG
jgi:glycosyltransferase involved in cell wall biosynthesis